MRLDVCLSPLEREVIARYRLLPFSGCGLGPHPRRQAVTGRLWQVIKQNPHVVSWGAGEVILAIAVLLVGEIAHAIRVPQRPA
jgi:hypothetical protein